VRLERVGFHGHEAVRLQGALGSVVVVTSVGPRVFASLPSDGGLFAVLPDAGLDVPGGERFAFVGGHRLWAAPEVPEVTYRPDDRPCAVIELPDGVRAEAPPDGAGLARSIEVRASSAAWIVDHVIRNASEAPITVAPWAITQLAPGGVAGIRFAGSGSGLQADRALVLWPYTRPDDPRIVLGADAVRIHAEPGSGPLKVGVAADRGSLWYERGGERLEKTVAVDPSRPYADRGAVVQVYVHEAFCELESLGPLREVPPGGRAEHRERWMLSPAGEPGR
jgi:hypothetical protein